MNRSVRDVGGQAIVVSQFTLYGDAQKGRRPSFTEAAPPEVGAPAGGAVCGALARARAFLRARACSGAEMLVEIHNDGPVTIWLEK